ncbi:hypothetical protein SAMN05216436_1309 [bacterium A37T11]|nr:hypothetical protein SAMN05216436_1309 [bacterium A37T11]
MAWYQKFYKKKGGIKVMAWFQLDVPSAPADPSSYSVNSSPSCSGNSQICAVQTTASGSGDPNLTDALKNEMLQALNTHTSTTNVRLKS